MFLAEFFDHLTGGDERALRAYEDSEKQNENLGLHVELYDILHEFDLLQTLNMPDVYVYPQSPYDWYVLFLPQTGYYAGAQLSFLISFRLGYPKVPPSLECSTSHPLVNPDSMLLNTRVFVDNTRGRGIEMVQFAKDMYMKMEYLLPDPESVKNTELFELFCKSPMDMRRKCAELAKESLKLPCTLLGENPSDDVSLIRDALKYPNFNLYPAQREAMLRSWLTYEKEPLNHRYKVEPSPDEDDDQDKKKEETSTKAPKSILRVRDISLEAALRKERGIRTSISSYNEPSRSSKDDDLNAESSPKVYSGPTLDKTEEKMIKPTHTMPQQWMQEAGEDDLPTAIDSLSQKLLVNARVALKLTTQRSQESLAKNDEVQDLVDGVSSERRSSPASRDFGGSSTEGKVMDSFEARLRAALEEEENKPDPSVISSIGGGKEGSGSDSVPTKTDDDNNNDAQEEAVYEKDGSEDGRAEVKSPKEAVGDTSESGVGGDEAENKSPKEGSESVGESHKPDADEDESVVGEEEVETSSKEGAIPPLSPKSEAHVDEGANEEEVEASLKEESVPPEFPKSEVQVDEAINVVEAETSPKEGTLPPQSPKATDNANESASKVEAEASLVEGPIPPQSLTATAGMGESAGKIEPEPSMTLRSQKTLEEKDEEKDKKRDKDKDRDKDKEKDKTRDKDKDKDKKRDRDKEKNRDKDKTQDKEKDRDKTREKDKDKTREKDKDKEREKDRDKDKTRDKDKDKTRDKDKEKDKVRDKDKEKTSSRSPRAEEDKEKKHSENTKISAAGDKQFDLERSKKTLPMTGGEEGTSTLPTEDASVLLAKSKSHETSKTKTTEKSEKKREKDDDRKKKEDERRKEKEDEKREEEGEGR